jgi:hypothetical protein
MNERFDPESVDLEVLRSALVRSCGSFVEGEIVGRTLLRDEAVVRLSCSELEAELIVDTLVARGFVRRETLEDGRKGWSVLAS